MKKAKMRIISLFLALTMLASLVTAFATSSEIIASGGCGKERSNITWELKSDGTLILSGSGEMADYGWAPWSGHRREITNVRLPEGLTTIGANAFYECSSLGQVEIPSSVTSIGDGAFWECSSLEQIEIPNSVTSIGENAFRECSSLVSIELLPGLTTIGDAAFSECSSLEQVQMPDSVTEMGQNVFNKCTSLSSVTLSNGLQKIPHGTFFQCLSLEQIQIPNSVTEIGMSAFEECRSLKQVNIPNGVSSIENKTFGACSSLEQVQIPDSVTKIGSYAFAGCRALALTELPDGLTSIGDCAFYDCYSLALTKLPDSLTSIDEFAFYDCKSLALAELPEGVTLTGRVNYTFFGVDWRVTTEHYIPDGSDGYKLAEVTSHLAQRGTTTTADIMDYTTAGLTPVSHNDEYITALLPQYYIEHGKAIVFRRYYGHLSVTVTIQDDRGGSTTQEVPYGGKATEPELDPKPGHVLTWETESGNRFDFNDPITEPVTVHPVWMPDMITVTINDDKGGSTTQEVPYGGKATEPELEERPGYKLIWVTGDGEHFDFDTPITEPITISPVWAPVGAIHGVVVDNQGRPVPGAHIAIVAGNTNYMETDANSNGHFWIYDVPYGSYDMITTKRALTVTSLFELDETVEDVTVTLPDAQTNSVLVVNQGTKDVVVGGLDELFTSEVYNEADQATVAGGGSVTVQMTVKAVKEDEIPESAQALNAAAAADGKTIFGYMEMDVSKITETAAGETAAENIPELPQLLQIIDPLSEEQKGKTGYVVYRMHEGTVYPITETPNVNGAYITVSDDTLTIYASKFSAYCLAFDDPSVKPAPGPSPVVTPDDDDDDDGRRNPFIDVKSDDWFYKDVLDAYDAGYMEGITSNAFKPNAPLTRAQAAYTFAKVAKAELKGLEITGDFEDVTSRTTYANAITWANDAGVEIGYGNGKFGPTDRLTREQLALMLYRTYGNGEEILAWDGAFADVDDVSIWAAEAVRWAAHVGLLEGTSSGELLPQGKVTRAEAAALIMRLLERR